MMFVRARVRNIARDVKSALRIPSEALAPPGLALQLGDADMSDRALRAARGAQPEVETMLATATSATEVALLSPLRWHRRRSEEHTSELQSRFDLVCRLLLEKRNGAGATRTGA